MIRGEVASRNWQCRYFLGLGNTQLPLLYVLQTLWCVLNDLLGFLDKRGLPLTISAALSRARPCYCGGRIATTAFPVLLFCVARLRSFAASANCFSL